MLDLLFHLSVNGARSTHRCQLPVFVARFPASRVPRRITEPAIEASAPTTNSPDTLRWARRRDTHAARRPQHHSPNQALARVTAGRDSGRQPYRFAILYPFVVFCSMHEMVDIVATN